MWQRTSKVIGMFVKLKNKKYKGLRCAKEICKTYSIPVLFEKQMGLHLKGDH